VFILFDIIVAVDNKNGIGKHGKLPWHLPEDMAHFKQITKRVQDPLKRNAVVMGRKTWDSIASKFRPLPDRLNIVLSHQQSLGLPEDVLLFHNLESALDHFSAYRAQWCVETFFLIGGASLYQQVLTRDACRRIYLTKIYADFNCDTFFPEISNDFSCQQASERLISKDIDCQFFTLEKRLSMNEM
jgi:dihydrofolate reductase